MEHGKRVFFPLFRYALNQNVLECCSFLIHFVSTRWTTYIIFTLTFKGNKEIFTDLVKIMFFYFSRHSNLWLHLSDAPIPASPPSAFPRPAKGSNTLLQSSSPPPGLAEHSLRRREEEKASPGRAVGRSDGHAICQQRKQGDRRHPLHARMCAVVTFMMTTSREGGKSCRRIMAFSGDERAPPLLFAREKKCYSG